MSRRNDQVLYRLSAEAALSGETIHSNHEVRLAAPLLRAFVRSLKPPRPATDLAKSWRSASGRCGPACRPFFRARP